MRQLLAPRRSQHDLIALGDTVEVLIAEGEVEAAYTTLAHGLRLGPGTAVQAQWLELLLTIPVSMRAAHGVGAWLTAQLLGNTRSASEVLDFAAVVRDGPLTSAEATPVYAYEAWALTHTEQHEAALALAATVLDAMPDTGPAMAAGIAWRARAQALFWLGRSGWEAAFAAAREHLTGWTRPLGTCWLEEGVLHDLAGQHAAARSAWREALLKLEYDAYYAAWLRDALGQSCLRFGLPDAEDHFLELQRLVRRPAARDFRARAACGLATARRARGEWARAETGYSQAIQAAVAAQDADDQRQAWRSLGHTYRLQGKFELAQEALLRAARCTARDQGSGTSWVYADIAATHAQRGDLPGARQALTLTGLVRGEDAERVAVVEAELAFRSGDDQTARDRLSTIDAASLWAREEARCFPEVFGLLPNVRRPLPLSHSPRMVVEVQALGTLAVKVNGRPVPVRATGRPGEVLVYLLEHGNRAPTEVMVDALYPGPDRQREKGQALWGVVKALRLALGWADSVQHLDGAYVLDPDAQWGYDVREALARGLPTPGFLTGVYQPWVVARAEELAERDFN